jgi:hypothetical protein
MQELGLAFDRGEPSRRCSLANPESAFANLPFQPTLLRAIGPSTSPDILAVIIGLASQAAMITEARFHFYASFALLSTYILESLV